MITIEKGSCLYSNLQSRQSATSEKKRAATLLGLQPYGNMAPLAGQRKWNLAY